MIMPTRQSQAVWQGTLKDGNGTMQIGSGGFEVDYSFPSRFEDGTGTNPEELIGAAHAGCLSMALAHIIVQAGYTPERIATRANVHLDKSGDGFSISRIELETTARIPGMPDADFQAKADEAKSSCPVSRALAGLDISLTASLDGSGQ